MKQLINATTILSLALYIVPPFAAQAQDLQKVMVGDQAVFCLPNKAAVCPEGDMCVLAKKAENCQANAEKEVAKKAAEAAGTVAPATDQAAADKAAADKAAADKAAADQAATEKAAADKAATDQAAAQKAAADKAAADQAAAEKAAADKAATEQANAEKKAAKKAAAEQAAAEKAAADKAASDQAAAAKAAADKAAADKAAADQAASTQAATDQAAADKAAADKTAADQAASTQAATDKAAADKAAADKAAADKAAADQAATAQAATTTPANQAPNNPEGLKSVMVNGTVVLCLPTKATVCPEGAVCAMAIKASNCQTNAEKKVAEMTAANPPATPPATTATTTQAADPNAPAQQTPEEKAAARKAAKKAAADQAALDAANIAAAQKAQEAAAAAAANDPNVKPVEAPVPDQQAVQTLATVLDAQTDPNATTQAEAPTAAAAAEANVNINTPPAQQPAPAGVTNVITQTVTVQDTRSSAQDFAAAPVAVAPGKKSGLSDLEKVGLVALGALVIGTVLQGNKQVVSNTGDRVVVRQDDGSYQVYKDDNALLLQPGNKVTTQTFKDGSTRTVVVREDGSQIATIRDASGRVLQRVAYDTHNHATVLIDDLQPEQVVDVTRLPKPRPQGNTIDVNANDAAMRAALAAANADDSGQKFSLRQIRTIQEVRFLAPTINVNDITFETGSAAIQPTEAKKLNKLGSFITQMIAQNPGEVFLIEGHTDAVGSAASNLALSDRRAESVAKALSEYFQVPPENLVVQGYGEEELLVPSAGDERANRRVAVRIITPLLRQTMN